MSDPQSILDVLDLAPVEHAVFEGRPSADGRSRVFGGHTVAQALAAACFTVDGLPCHSLHAYFVRPGLPGRPTRYEVSAVRDGNSFATRQVLAVQRDEVVLHMSASFHAHEDGGFYHALTGPAAPDPDSFPPEDERIARLLQAVPPDLRELVQRKLPIEQIRVDDFEPAPDAATQRSRTSRAWMRTRARDLPSDPNLHRCALAYASDLGPLEPSIRAVGASFGDSALQVASLDHALWFHGPVRFDAWNLFVFDCAAAGEGRAFGRGSVFNERGELVASIAQEGVLRRR